MSTMRMARATRVSVFGCLLLVSAAAVLAQEAPQIAPGTTVQLTSSAPVYLMPDPKRVPLRTLPAGTVARADRVQNGWVRITFNDPQFGPRTGWVEMRLVKIDAAPPSTAPTRPGQASPLPRQTAGRPQTAPPRQRPSPLPRVFGTVSVDKMAAADSFDAVTGSSTIPAWGGGVQVADAWRRLFVEFAVDYSTSDGERVFVFDDQVFRLGIPLKITMLPLDITAGWRVPLGRVTPFAGGGFTALRYEETSDFSADDENIREWHYGFVTLAGVETRLTRIVHLRADVRYRRLEEALGQHGASAAFGETRLGGFGASVKVMFGR